mmetsp:Transcript_27113/g.64528  ORF Transcript_27113/g.64528 Transcript_27113/m.64528 type:complete len:216 (-) Transcript_27113:333-980(-)
MWTGWIQCSWCSRSTRSESRACSSWTSMTCFGTWTRRWRMRRPENSWRGAASTCWWMSTRTPITCRPRSCRRSARCMAMSWQWATMPRASTPFEVRTSRTSRTLRRCSQVAECCTWKTTTAARRRSWISPMPCSKTPRSVTASIWCPTALPGPCPRWPDATLRSPRRARWQSTCGSCARPYRCRRWRCCTVPTSPRCCWRRSCCGSRFPSSRWAL